MLGYSVPASKADDFLVALDKAAKHIGAIPFQEHNLESDDRASESEILRAWIDEKDEVVISAQSLLNNNE